MPQIFSSETSASISTCAASPSSREQWITVPFFYEGERLEVKLCLVPNRPLRGASPSYSLQGIAPHHSHVTAQQEEKSSKQPVINSPKSGAVTTDERAGKYLTFHLVREGFGIRC